MLRLLLASVVIFASIDGYKILVYSPKLGHSHSNFMGRIADTLVDAGHNVTTLIPCAMPLVADGTTKSRIIHVVPDDNLATMFNDVLNGEFNPFEISIFDPIGTVMQGRIFGGLFANLCRATINTPGLVEKLRADTYDVLIAEPFELCGLGMAPYIAPKATIIVSSTALMNSMYSDLGIPLPLSYNPSFIMSSLNPHSIIDRFWNILAQVLSIISFPRSWTEDVLRERFGHNHPSISSIASHAAVAFTNGEPLLNVASPTLHKVIDIAGLGADEPKALEKEWLEILGLRPRIVLVSFGSIAKSSLLKPEAKQAILETVAHFPDVTFIWKYEKTDDDFAMNEAAKLPNLVLSNWMPQNDLLNHTRLAAFVTHGEMGSVQEAARGGVPVIVLPLFGDQARNALMMQERGLGKVLDKRHIRDSPRIIAALEEILRDESYKTRALEMARKLAGKPFSAKELLVKHVEFAAEFGASASLRPASIDMSLVELYNLDLLLIGLIVVLATAMLILRLVQFKILRMIAKSKLE